MRHLGHRYELPVEPRDGRLDVALSTIAVVFVVAAFMALGSLVLSAIVNAIAALMVVTQ